MGSVSTQKGFILLIAIPILGVLGWIMQSVNRPSAALVSRGPVSLALVINRVASAPTVDLPPLDQKPALYADLELDGERFRTETEQTPQIGANIYPGWALHVEKEAIWLEPGHFVSAALRIFDEDFEDADDKILLTSLAFDPIACYVNIGDTQVEGDRQGRSCTVTIPALQGENGSAGLTLTASWE